MHSNFICWRLTSQLVLQVFHPKSNDCSEDYCILCIGKLFNAKKKKSISISFLLRKEIVAKSNGKKID